MPKLTKAPNKRARGDEVTPHQIKMVQVKRGTDGMFILDDGDVISPKVLKKSAKDFIRDAKRKLPNDWRFGEVEIVIPDKVRK